MHTMEARVPQNAYRKRNPQTVVEEPGDESFCLHIDEREF